jgi:uncharacterized protein YbjT (DUF2867 family)
VLTSSLAISVTLLLRAAGDVDTMFLMGNSYEAGVEEEIRQGIIAADAAKAADVGHLIYSSVADANKKTGIPHFESKYLVEKHVAGLGIPYTISAPVAFMEIGSRGPLNIFETQISCVLLSMT